MHTPKHPDCLTLSSSVQQGSPHPALPAPPEPSTDPGIAPTISSTCDDNGSVPASGEIDIFDLSPVAALKMLCGTIEALVRITGDIPPTPPISQPTTPNLQVMQTEKQNVARHKADWGMGQPRLHRDSDGAEVVDGVPLKKTPIGTPEAADSEPLPIIGSNMEPLNIQHGAITRKFYSKKPPPIPLEEYLLRVHRYCPMSTAVYLATSLYIHKLAVIERIIPVTGRNVHRLLLAALRVAMKALEDLSYPHRRFAKVGGVSESELGRLEVSFCFLTNFELKVNKEMLLRQATAMRDGKSLYGLPAGFQPKLPPLAEKRKTPRRQITPTRAVQIDARTAS
ncbi:hypothetical protein MMC08_001801 [Hypocenomyce scalaris]|nr:hypothetical protein [Hypocenomyce scalaris]